VSLINEALRKARQAASEHDSKQPEGPFRPAKAYPSRRSGRGNGLSAIALIAVAAGVIGASAAWWFLGDRPIYPTEPIVSGGPSFDAATPMASAEPSPVPADVRLESDSSRAPAQQMSEPTSIRSEDSVATNQNDAEPVQIKSSPANAASQKPVVGPDGERVYVMEAEIGGVSLSLGYIVARSTNPFAEINGNDVYVGSEIDGFVVEAIEADRVILRDEKGPLVLRVP
jgi:hypothetical protein